MTQIFEIEKENFTSLLDELRCIYKDTKKNHILNIYGDREEYFKFNIELINNMLIVGAKLGLKKICAQSSNLRYASWTKETTAIINHYHTLMFSACYDGYSIHIGWT